MLVEPVEKFFEDKGNGTIANNSWCTVYLVSSFSISFIYVVQLNLLTTATLRTEESGSCGEVAVYGLVGMYRIYSINRPGRLFEVGAYSRLGVY